MMVENQPELTFNPARGMWNVRGMHNLPDLFARHVFEVNPTESLPYRLLAPRSLEQGQRYPLIIFLHGVGERGEDNERQLRHGAGPFVEPAVRQKYPCWLLIPQCPSTHYWVDPDARRRQAGQPNKMAMPLRLTMDVVSTLEDGGAIDSNRIYLIGLSMGGFGTWDLAARHPERFAAAVPICGGGEPATAPKLRDMPLWAFHGARDEVVPAMYSRLMIEAIRAVGGEPRYTEYPDVGHNAWDPALREPDLLPWLFAQRTQQ